jgi:hypothetical protein
MMEVERMGKNSYESQASSSNSMFKIGKTEKQKIKKLN